VEKILNRIYDFLVAYDFPTILKAIGNLEWGQAAKSPYTWLILFPVLIYLAWTKKYKIITALVSFVLFLLLVQKTLSPDSEVLSLHDVMVFLSGAVVLVGLNVYLLFIRQ
jgi:hypothetical protein